jgi:hypothetical protein
MSTWNSFRVAHCIISKPMANIPWHAASKDTINSFDVKKSNLLVYTSLTPAQLQRDAIITHRNPAKFSRLTPREHRVFALNRL